MKERQRRRLATHRTMLWPRLSSCWALEKRHAVVSRLPRRRLYCLHCLQIRRLQIRVAVAQSRLPMGSRCYRGPLP